MQKNEKTRALRTQISKLVEEYAAISLEPNPFVPGVTMIPPSGKLIGAVELKNMVEASLDSWLTTGRFNFQFEKKLAIFLGVIFFISFSLSTGLTLCPFQRLT